MTLRVGVNLLYLRPRVVGGSEVYVVRLLDALAARGGDVAVTLFVNRRFGDAHPGLAAAYPTAVAPISGERPPVRIAFESSWLAAETRRRRLRVVHHVANTIPFVHPGRNVVTVHDLQPFVRPQDFGAVKGAYLRNRLRAAAREAAVVVTPSGYVRDVVLERFPREGSTVAIVPAPIVIRDATGREAAPVASRITGPYFLYPAITHPHKNHVTLLRAFARVASERAGVSLVLTGGVGEAERAVRSEIQRLGLGARVLRVGRVPRGDLEDLFDRATALAFPSRHEGYGLPVAEALAAGCPVLASNMTALPEVVDDAGVLLDPDDVEGWTGAMLHVLDDDAFRTRLAARGRERVAALSPEHAARGLVAAYRLAGEG